MSAPKPALKNSAPAHPPYKVMVLTIIAEQKERNGSSRQKIVTGIKAKYGVVGNVSRNVTKALKKLEEEKKVVKSEVGAKYKLTPEAKAAGEKKPAKKPAPKKPAAKKTTAKPKKPATKKPAAKKTDKKKPAKKTTTPKKSKTPTKKSSKAKSPAKKAGKKPTPKKAKKPAAKKPQKK